MNLGNCECCKYVCQRLNQCEWFVFHPNNHGVWLLVMWLSPGKMHFLLGVNWFVNLHCMTDILIHHSQDQHIHFFLFYLSSSGPWILPSISDQGLARPHAPRTSTRPRAPWPAPPFWTPRPSATSWTLQTATTRPLSPPAWSSWAASSSQRTPRHAPAWTNGRRVWASTCQRTCLPPQARPWTCHWSSRSTTATLPSPSASSLWADASTTRCVLLFLSSTSSHHWVVLVSLSVKTQI